jgi:isoleucyl-tRNA synthetase
MCPFMADTVWRHLTGADETQSVHLEGWPVAKTELIDPDLEAQMALARRLTSLGRAARSEAGVKVRQPLARALVFLPADSPDILRDVVADELNVDEIDTGDELGEVIQFDLAANFRTLGPRLGERAQHLKSALSSLDGAAAAEELEAGRPITVTLAGEPVELSPDDVQLRVRGQEGFAVSRDGGEVVALDLTMNESLRKRGLAREVVRQVQDLRKTSGLEVSDRIKLRLVGLDFIAKHFDFIAREVLATEILTESGEGEGTVLELEDLDGSVPARVWLEKDEGLA